jgi:hypothetical protein
VLTVLWTHPFADFAAAAEAEKTIATASQADARRVVVVRNENSPVSCAVADDYARRRRVPNVLSVRCQDAAAIAEKETISYAAYEQAVEKPLRAFLAAHASIDFIVLTKTDTFAGGRAGLLGYVSWGSNDRHYAAAAYHSLRFAPGAVCDTAVSTSARTFLPTRGGQSLIADLIAQGVTGVKGYTDEPLLQAVASPTVLFDRYTRGWTLAESFYAASRFVGWEDIVIGDPLCCPYRPKENRGHSAESNCTPRKADTREVRVPAPKIAVRKAPDPPILPNFHRLRVWQSNMATLL